MNHCNTAVILSDYTSYIYLQIIDKTEAFHVQMLTTRRHLHHHHHSSSDWLKSLGKWQIFPDIIWCNYESFSRRSWCTRFHLYAVDYQGLITTKYRLCAGYEISYILILTKHYSLSNATKRSVVYTQSKMHTFENIWFHDISNPMIWL